MIAGPSGSGKSTLVRHLVGAAQPAGGSVRLDGTELHHWDAEQLGRHMGYMPQDVKLFRGTVSENISRFIPDAEDADPVNPEDRWFYLDTLAAAAFADGQVDVATRLQAQAADAAPNEVRDALSERLQAYRDAAGG